MRRVLLHHTGRTSLLFLVIIGTTAKSMSTSKKDITDERDSQDPSRGGGKTDRAAREDLGKGSSMRTPGNKIEDGAAHDAVFFPGVPQEEKTAATTSKLTSRPSSTKGVSRDEIMKEVVAVRDKTRHQTVPCPPRPFLLRDEIF